MKDLISLEKYSEKEILSFIELAQKIKKSPKKYYSRLYEKTLLMLFAKPSLRTRLSFEIAMLELGGHAIFYEMSESVLGKKESIKDGAQVSSRFVDVIMARLYEHKEMEELAHYSTVPVISGLDNEEHPCQVLGDLLTTKEKFKKLKGLNLAYFGDANNNVTHSLLYACPKVGINLTIVCPNKKEFLPNQKIFSKAKKLEKDSKINLIHNLKNLKAADIIYTDSWMSYHIKSSEEKRRAKILQPFQVNKNILKKYKNTLFMHCLPAKRGMEITDEVLDSKRSIHLDQAENRLHIEKAILLKLLKRE